MKRCYLLLSIITFMLAGSLAFAETIVPYNSADARMNLAKADKISTSKSISEAKELLDKADKEAAEFGRDIKKDTEKEAENVKRETGKIFKKSKKEIKRLDTRTKHDYNSVKDTLN